MLGVIETNTADYGDVLLRQRAKELLDHHNLIAHNSFPRGIVDVISNDDSGFEASLSCRASEIEVR